MANPEDFSKDEQIRYSRHFVLPGFGKQSQKKLKQARVVVVGAGGLGAPVLSYLAAAGLGHITIIDHDRVHLSNLQRQVIFRMEDIDKPKAECARRFVEALNPEISVTTIQTKITSANALKLLEGCDVVVDTTDNFPTRYLLNDACVLLGKPLVYGAIFRYEGQASVFNYSAGPNYRDLYPQPPKPGSVPDCEAGGVLGVLPGIIGSIQANEVIKIITGIGEPLSGKLLLVDSLNMGTQMVTFPKKNDVIIQSLIDYDEFCGLTATQMTNMKEITVQELKALKDADADFQLIDVREPHEFDLCNLGGELIPMSEVPEHVDLISKSRKVILHCRSGSRSGNMVQWLEKNHGFTNLYNLKGGIRAWAQDVDPSMPTY